MDFRKVAVFFQKSVRKGLVEEMTSGLEFFKQVIKRNNFSSMRLFRVTKDPI